jgi:hypothetical protein
VPFEGLECAAGNKLEKILCKGDPMSGLQGSRSALAVVQGTRFGVPGHEAPFSVLHFVAFAAGTIVHADVLQLLSVGGVEDDALRQWDVQSMAGVVVPGPQDSPINPEMSQCNVSADSHMATCITYELPGSLLNRVVQVLEETTGHTRTFARNFSFLAVFLPGCFSTMGRNFRAWPKGRPEASNRAKRVLFLGLLCACCICLPLFTVTGKVYLFPNLVRQHYEKVRVDRYLPATKNCPNSPKVGFGLMAPRTFLSSWMQCYNTIQLPSSCDPSCISTQKCENNAQQLRNADLSLL